MLPPLDDKMGLFHLWMPGTGAGGRQESRPSQAPVTSGAHADAQVPCEHAYIQVVGCGKLRCIAWPLHPRRPSQWQTGHLAAHWNRPHLLSPELSWSWVIISLEEHFLLPSPGTGLELSRPTLLGETMFWTQRPIL